jgi:hypothetical protein
MASITLAIDERLKSEMSKLLWVNWSEIVRERLIERKKQAELLLSKLESKEEKELIRWSVDLGRRAKKDSFKRLLSGLSPKKREELLNAMSPEKREEYQ